MIKKFVRVLACLLFFGIAAILIAAAAGPYQFAGHWQGVLAERLPNGKFHAIDQVTENNYRIRFEFTDLSGSGLLNTANTWSGQSQKGLSIAFRQAGPSRVRLEGGSVQVQALWEVSIAGQKCPVPFAHGSGPSKIPAGFPIQVPGGQTAIHTSQESAQLQLSGFTVLDQQVSSQLQEILRRSGKKEQSWKSGELALAVFFTGNVSRVGK